MPGRQYYWYDTPDGQDLLLKTSFASKIGFMAACPAVVTDLALNPQKNLRTYLYRAGKFVVPAVGTGAMFALTSQLLIRHVPQIKPEYSYMIGGAAAGTVVGAAVRSMAAGGVLGFYFGIIAWVAHDIHSKAPFNPSIFGSLPRTTVLNDDEFLAADYRKAPPMSLPPPIARPAKSPSSLDSWMI